jgi:hypothetical protein
VDFLLEVSETTRVLFQRHEPRFRIGLKALLNLGQDRVNATDPFPVLAFHANFHVSSFLREQPDSVQAIEVEPTVSRLAFGITPFWVRALDLK